VVVVGQWRRASKDKCGTGTDAARTECIQRIDGQISGLAMMMMMMMVVVVVVVPSEE
jgi:hypothetical protein